MCSSDLIFPNSRFTLPFLPGMALALAGVAGLIYALGLRRTRIGGALGLLFAAAVFGLATGFHFLNAAEYRRDWTLTKDFFRQLSWRIPALAPSAALAECRRLYDEGVSVLADIGNSDLPLGLMDRFRGRLLAFHEYLGITERDSDRNRARLQLEADSRLCSAHAPYSTHPALLQALKSRARRLGQILPIHVAEPPEELELLRSGGGEMAAFSRARAQDELRFQPAVAPTEGSIHYLYRLGLLDAETLCVHAVHLSEAELDILAGTGAKVCLCPGSNRFLGVGSAPVLRFLAHGILPALGTDSSASNPELSLWREMRLLAETPGLKPET